MPSKEKITIVGAGLVGSLLTCLLAERGYHIQLVEKRSDPRTTQIDGGRSINLALSTRGLKALDLAGMAEAIQPSLIPMKGRLMHDTSGKLTFQAYGKENQHINSVSRGGLNQLLMEKADTYSNVEILFDQRCESVDFDQNSISFVHTQTNEEKTIESDFIIGADGAFSAIRSTMQRTDRFNYAQHFIEHGYKELTIPASASGAFALDKNALHIWPRKSFMLIALPNTDGSFTCTLFLPFEGDVSFEQLNTSKEVEQFFKTHFPDTLELIPNLSNEFFENPTSSLVTVRCEPWLKQNTLLIGDASHAIVPFYGQGMNAGFEDCSIFIELLDALNGDLAATVAQFAKDRVADANAIADLALQNFIEMRDLVADPQFLLRKKIEAKLHELFPEKWVPLYSLVTFSHTPYREALRIGNKQDSIMNELLKMEGLAENWEQLDWAALLSKYLN
ncbi:MAG: FAD-dependent oxidoreductase [Flammeovirgaceae bacterium]